MRDVIERLASGIRALGFKVAVLGREALGVSAAPLPTLEGSPAFLPVAATRARRD